MTLLGVCSFPLLLLYSFYTLPFTNAEQNSGIPSRAAKFTSNLLTGTLKGTTKAGYYLVQPKHVEVEEVYGLWRLDLDDGGILNLEVTPKSVVLVDPREQEKLVLPYEFRASKWPVRARIEFKTKKFAYQVVIHRKVVAKNVIKLKGKIQRLGRWGASREVVHTFRGKRRLQVEVEPQSDDEVEAEDEDHEDEETELESKRDSEVDDEWGSDEEELGEHDEEDEAEL